MSSSETETDEEVVVSARIVDENIIHGNTVPNRRYSVSAATPPQFTNDSKKSSFANTPTGIRTPSGVLTPTKRNSDTSSQSDVNITLKKLSRSNSPNVNDNSSVINITHLVKKSSDSNLPKISPHNSSSKLIPDKQESPTTPRKAAPQPAAIPLREATQIPNNNTSAVSITSENSLEYVIVPQVPKQTRFKATADPLDSSGTSSSDTESMSNSDSITSESDTRLEPPPTKPATNNVKFAVTPDARDITVSNLLVPKDGSLRKKIQFNTQLELFEMVEKESQLKSNSANVTNSGKMRPIKSPSFQLSTVPSWGHYFIERDREHGFLPFTYSTSTWSRSAYPFPPNADPNFMHIMGATAVPETDIPEEQPNALRKVSSASAVSVGSRGSRGLVRDFSWGELSEQALDANGFSPFAARYLVCENPVSINVDNYSLDIKPTDLMSVLTSWRSPIYSRRKALLKNISFSVYHGQMLAILGSSGSGKTTLLNAIAGRLENVIQGARIISDGNIQFNGLNSKYMGRRQASVIGYVTQEDNLLPNLTVKETLRFAALLRLPNTFSKQDKMEIVDEVIVQMGLKDCANSFVGGPGSNKRGISGGERRRVSIAIQILTNPSVLLLDEPTTGLDSFTSHLLVESLLSLALKEDRTIAFTIHQPRSDIFELFDLVLLLSKGKMVYYGPASKMKKYFSSMNYECPAHTNPADYFLDISSIDFRSEQAKNDSAGRVEALSKEYQKKAFTQRRKSEKNIRHKKEMMEKQGVRLEDKSLLRPEAGFFRASRLLIHRSYLNMFRHPSAITRVSQALALAIVMCLCIWRMKNDQVGVQNRVGFFHNCLSLCFVGLLNAVALFPRERNVFYHEYADGLYGSMAFLVSYMSSEIPLNLLGSLAFSTVTYWVMDLNAEWWRFLDFVLIIMCLLISGESIGILACVIFYDVAIVTIIASATIACINIMAGFFRPVANLPLPLEYLTYLFPGRYAASALAINEFKGLSLQCPPDQALASGQCQFQDGNDVLELYHFHSSFQQMWIDIACIVGLAIIYRMIAFLLLKFRKPVTT